MKHYLKIFWYFFIAFVLVFSVSFTALSLYRNNDALSSIDTIPPPVLMPHNPTTSVTSEVFLNGCKAGIAVSMDDYKEGTLTDMEVLWNHCDHMNVDEKTTNYISTFATYEEKLFFSCGVGIGEAGNHFHNLEIIKSKDGELERLGGLCVSAVNDMLNGNINTPTSPSLKNDIIM